MSLRISLRDTETGQVHVHAVSSFGNYATICGCSDDDDQFNVVEGQPAGKIDCPACYAIFRDASCLRARRDFTDEVRR